MCNKSEKTRKKDLVNDRILAVSYNLTSKITIKNYNKTIITFNRNVDLRRKGGF